MSTDRLQYLLDRLFHYTITEEEREELALWIDTLQSKEEWNERISKIWNSYSAGTQGISLDPLREKMDPSRAGIILKKILSEGKKENEPAKTVSMSYTPVSKGLMRWSVAAAAVVGILIVLSLVFFVPRPGHKRLATAHKETPQKQHILPGSNKAVLTLANGKKIVLDSANNGLLVSQQNAKVIKLSNGLLKFQQSATPNTQKVTEYNVISTPRGGQYRIILPDGSKVWLNAASSIRFPIVFSEKERTVQITGEAYFEVAKNAHKPFIVKKGNMEVRVLGTHFNVMAYDNEANIKVTLLEGLVRISQQTTHNTQLIKPGEQALISKKDIQVNKEVNLNEVIAWKNGLFDFEGNDIRDVMQQIARWYDVEVKYEDIPSAHFMGTISRSAEVSEVLKMLEMTGAVQFQVEGKMIIVKEAPGA